MFRPKYCCNCGEKVQRSEWRLWTSRRFCELCSTEYKHIDLIPFGAVGGGLLLGLLGLSGILRGHDSREVGKIDAPAISKSQLKPPAQIAGPSIESAKNATGSGPQYSSSQNTEQPKKKEISSEEPVFYCGAPTKKGTPCTRRVKVKGYCWQHAKSGQIAPTRF